MDLFIMGLSITNSEVAYTWPRISLVVQRLIKLRVSNVGGVGLIPGQGTSSHMAHGQSKRVYGTPDHFFQILWYTEL